MIIHSKEQASALLESQQARIRQKQLEDAVKQKESDDHSLRVANAIRNLKIKQRVADGVPRHAIAKEFRVGLRTINRVLHD